MYNPEIHKHKYHKFMNLKDGEIFALEEVLYFVWSQLLADAEPDGRMSDAPFEEGLELNPRALFEMVDYLQTFIKSERRRREKGSWLTKEERKEIAKTGSL